MSNYQIDFLEAKQRIRDGNYYDVVDYFFSVSNGELRRVVAVGLTGQFHDPAEALGLKRMTKIDRIEAASSWLRSRIDKGYDPFSEPTPQTYDMPSPIVEYWIEHHSIPEWL